MQISIHTDMKSTKEAIFFTENPKINPFVAKSLLESNCKRFGQNAIRENFNLKHEPQLKTKLSKNGGNFTHQKNDVKEKL